MTNGDFLPRNEYEMCGFFEDLLFMKTEKFSPELEQEPENSKLKLNDKEIALLDKTGVLNRIFRRWFQTTWLYEGNSKHFEGATPRQELANLYPDLDQGWDFISVKLVDESCSSSPFASARVVDESCSSSPFASARATKDDKRWKISPCYFSKKWLEEEKNVFEFGLKNLKNNKNELVEPQLDCEFEVFVDWLSRAEKVAKKINPERMKFENDFIKYLMLFFETAPSNIVLNSKMNLTLEKLAKVSWELREYLFFLFKNQPRGKDNYWDIDDVFFNCWNIFRKADKSLVSYKDIISIQNRVQRIKESKSLQKSAETMYRLGVAFDRYFLFPLDRYFGGMEIVWTNKQAFSNELVATINLLKNNLKIKHDFKAERKFLNIKNIVYNIRHIWFVPSISFRFLDSIYRYF